LGEDGIIGDLTFKDKDGVETAPKLGTKKTKKPRKKKRPASGTGFVSKRRRKPISNLKQARKGKAVPGKNKANKPSSSKLSKPKTPKNNQFGDSLDFTDDQFEDESLHFSKFTTANNDNPNQKNSALSSYRPSTPKELAYAKKKAKEARRKLGKDKKPTEIVGHSFLKFSQSVKPIQPDPDTLPLSSFITKANTKLTDERQK
jgi:hypothetical protein